MFVLWEGKERKQQAGGIITWTRKTTGKGNGVN
jgi:hypothetical protein